MDQTSGVKADANLGALFDFGFHKFITLGVIKFLYILWLVILVIGAAAAWVSIVIAGFSTGVLAGVGALVVGTVVIAIVLALYVILIRVGLELIVVVFRIGENTSKLVDLKAARPAE